MRLRLLKLKLEAPLHWAGFWNDQPGSVNACLPWQQGLRRFRACSNSSCSDVHLLPRDISELLLREQAASRTPAGMLGWGNASYSCISPQTPLFPQPAFSCPVLDQQRVDVEKQAHWAHNLSRTTSQISQPQLLPAEGSKLENALSSPSLLSQYRCFSWEAHPFILMPNAPAGPAVTKIDRLCRKRWRLCQASPWWRRRPGSIPVSRTSTSTPLLAC